jgi:uncharacterized protein with ParB-like and HNH nuclease domain
MEMIDNQDSFKIIELQKRVNSLQLLLEILLDKLIDNEVVDESEILEELDRLDEKLKGTQTFPYFGPKIKA